MAVVQIANNLSLRPRATRSAVRTTRRRTHLKLEHLETRFAPAVVVEYAQLPGNPIPFGITAGPSNDLLFTEYGANQIGTITTQGSVLPPFIINATGASPLGMTRGPSTDPNAFWFTEPASALSGGTSSIQRQRWGRRPQCLPATMTQK